MLEKCMYSFLYLNKWHQTIWWRHVWSKHYTFCAYTVNFWDSYNVFWSFHLTIFFKKQNWISKKKKKKKRKRKKKKKKKKSNPSLPKLWVSQKRANKHLFFLGLGNMAVPHPVAVKEIFSDSKIIILGHESEDVNKKCLFPKNFR